MTSQSAEESSEIVERLQTWLRGVDVTVLGSGASADYKYPTMSQLADQLINRITPAPDDVDAWEDIRKKLLAGEGLEQVLDEVNANSGLIEEIVRETWRIVTERDLAFFDEVIERKIDFALPRLIRWLRTDSRQIDLVTTNYDRVIEFACDYENITWADGTGFGYMRDKVEGFDVRLNFNNNFRQSVIARIWKVHGSLDWFSRKEDERFIRTALRSQIPDHLIPLIITPGQSKYERSYDIPFRGVLTGADEVFDRSTTFLCIGYGFNDKHVHTNLIEKAKDPQSKIVVSAHKLTANTKSFLYDSGCQNFLAFESSDIENQTFVYTPASKTPTRVVGDMWCVRGLLEQID